MFKKRQNSIVILAILAVLVLAGFLIYNRQKPEAKMTKPDINKVYTLADFPAAKIAPEELERKIGIGDSAFIDTILLIILKHLPEKKEHNPNIVKLEFTPLVEECRAQGYNSYRNEVEEILK
jgi:hypothetical protein